MMRWTALAIDAGLACAAHAAEAKQLPSIEGLTLDAEGYVSSFEIDTWGVRVIAVCHISDESSPYATRDRGHF